MTDTQTDTHTDGQTLGVLKSLDRKISGLKILLKEMLMLVLYFLFIDLEAQPSLDPEDTEIHERPRNDHVDEDDEDESYPLLKETNLGGQTGQTPPVSTSKSLRRQYR